MSPEAPKKMVKFKLNGQEVEAAENSLVIDAAKAAGVEIPHYCYHPALGNPGNCRLCIVEVAGMPKPMVSCRLPVKEGMDVKSDSEAARRAQASSLELHLVNHPLDCPVCDQAGECGLQDYYMKFGKYESQVKEDKLHKRKATEIGPHVMLDQERCVLCTRCTRFTEKVDKTNALGIFGRGHTERIDLAPGKTLEHGYSGNVVDICPVGALTDKDFRFKVRVWYLDKTPSVCTDCARGCTINVHTNTKRPWHFEGRRVVRYKPRFNEQVNKWWLCDDGRYGYTKYDEDRLGRVMRLQPYRREHTWEAALAELESELRKGLDAKGPEGLYVVASGMLSNEDWASLRSFSDELKLKNFLFTPEPDQIGLEDELLRRKEKVPNLEGGKAHGFGTTTASLSWDQLERDLDAGKVWGLYLLDRDPVAVWGEEKARRLLSKCALVVWQSPWKKKAGELAHFRLPSTAHVEEEGHFTNFQGITQAYQKALEPLGLARPDHATLDALRQRLSKPAPAEAR